MDKIINYIMVACLLCAAWLLLHLAFGVPIPEWYDNWTNSMVSYKIQSDPFYKLAKEYQKQNSEKDSLIKIIDSLKKHNQPL